MILFDMNRPFFFKSKIQNWWNGRDYDCWLHTSIVRIIKSELQKGNFRNFIGCVRRQQGGKSNSLIELGYLHEPIKWKQHAQKEEWTVLGT